MLLGTMKELDMRSLGCTEARYIRFSVFDTSDAPGYRRRAENRVGDLCPEPKVKGQG